VTVTSALYWDGIHLKSAILSNWFSWFN